MWQFNIQHHANQLHLYLLTIGVTHYLHNTQTSEFRSKQDQTWESTIKIVAGHSFKSKRSGRSAKLAFSSPDGIACKIKLRRDRKCG